MKISELIQKVNDGVIKSDIDVQREIIYNAEKQKLVIDSIINDIPLPAFYFWQNDDGKLEVLDGKQRIEAIKKFVQNDLEYEGKIWKYIDKSIQDKINNTELRIIISSGTEKLKRDIFFRINTLGVPLSDFEVLNGLYSGEYLRGLTAFVKQDREVLRILKNNSRGINQYYLLKNLTKLADKKTVDEYVEPIKNTSFAVDQKKIKPYINFISDIFDKFDDKDILFQLAVKYIKDKNIWVSHKDAINTAIKEYRKSDYAKLTKNKQEDYEEIINATIRGKTVDPKRLFTDDDKKELFKKSKPNAQGQYQCAKCKQHYTPEQLEVDHIKAWTLGGRTDLNNAQLLCRFCNKSKGKK